MIFVKKTIYLPSFKFFLLIFIFILILAYFFINKIQVILSSHKPIEKAEIMVIDGWLPDYALDIVVNKILVDDYFSKKKIYIVGGDLEVGSFLSSYKNYANLTKHRLLARGIYEENLVSIPSKKTYTNRTFYSCVALKSYFVQNKIKIPSSINLITLGVHGRRSRIVYQKVFNDKIPIGIYSIRSKAYDVNRWWSTSAGLKTTITELSSVIFEYLFNSAR